MKEFEEHVKALQWGAWKPKLITIHHTGIPDLKQRPAGFTAQHMLNLKDFYERKNWSAGPHLFTDDDQVWLFTPLTERGVHAVSFNRDSIGIEMLGNYDVEDPWSGRGLAVLEVSMKATAALMKRLCMGVDAIRFHRDDPRTTKTCPGKRIRKEEFLRRLQVYLK